MKSLVLGFLIGIVLGGIVCIGVVINNSRNRSFLRMLRQERRYRRYKQHLSKKKTVN